MPNTSNRRDALPFSLYHRRKPKRTGPSRVNLRSVAFFVSAVLLIGLVGWLYLLQASEVAGYAHDIRQLQEQKEQLHRELVVLQGQVAEAGSLRKVMEASSQLGYSLPDALDAQRRLRVGYTPLAKPTPVAQVEEQPSETAQGQAAGRFQSVIANLMEQVKAWLNTPPDYSTVW